MMTLKEIIHANIDPKNLDPKKLAQCEDLLRRVNIIRKAWAKAMYSSSGVRTWADHIRIYKDLAKKKQHPFKDGIFDEAKVPKFSKHLEIVTDCAAVDILDPGQAIKKWLKDTEAGRKVMEEADVWCEDDDVQRLHIQNKAFGSYKPGGTRWFKP